MNKPITLLGMSGAGKTHFSARLAAWGWTHYSCDFEIAKTLGIDVAVEDLSALSDFIGQAGDEAKGGLPLEEFKRRQRLYYDAECEALRNAKYDTNRFVNDATGSFCEINDEGLIAQLADQSIFVYIETDEETQKEVIARAKEYPKPLFFPPEQFDAWLDEYCEENKVDHTGFEPSFDPGDFSAWVFPKLYESRLPKYERLAELYGVKVSAKDLHAVEDEGQFLELLNHRD